MTARARAPQDASGPAGLTPDVERVTGAPIGVDSREAMEALRALVWASDACRGHRGCAHSMEPWQRARALLDRVDNAPAPADAAEAAPSGDVERVVREIVGRHMQVDCWCPTCAPMAAELTAALAALRVAPAASGEEK